MSAAWRAFEDAVARIGEAPNDLDGRAVWRQELLWSRDRAMRDQNVQPGAQRSRSRGEIGGDLLRRSLTRRRVERRRALTALCGQQVPSGQPDRELQRIRQALSDRRAAKRAALGLQPLEPLLNEQLASADMGPGWASRYARLTAAMDQNRGGNGQDREQAFPGWDESIKVIYGLNGLHAYEGDDDVGSPGDSFGQPSDIFEDCTLLGVQVVRHPGKRDLTFEQVLTGRAGRTVVLPLVGEMESQVADYGAKIREELLALDAAGQSVVFTLCSYGGGSGATADIDDGKDRWWERDDGLEVENAIQVQWDGDHASKTIGGVAWDGSTLGALDIRSEYQRRYLERYVTAVCEMLHEIEGELYEGVGIDAVIAGLELFNEIDVRNVLPNKDDDEERYGEDSARDSGGAWGAVLYRLAKVVYQAFGGRVPVQLPGLSSFALDEEKYPKDRQEHIYTWAWKYSFFDALIQAFGAAFDADTGWAGRPITGPSSLAVNADLHFYHKSRHTADNIDPLHIGRLHWQLDRMRESLDDAGMSLTHLTVFESGASALRSDDFMPDMAPDRVTWQAWEVWRRLAGSLAAGSRVASWHSWRGTDSSGRSDAASNEFYGMGLREDNDRGGGSSGVVVPSEAYQRLSWFAYQRFSSIFRYLSSTTMVLPGDYDVDTESSAHDDAIVIEFRGLLASPSGSRWYPCGYLFMLDGWRDTSDDVLLALDPVGGVATSAALVRTLPRAVFSRAGASGDLPQSEPFYSPFGLGASVVTFTISSGGRHWRLSVADGPQLILCDRRLTWTVTR